MYTNFNKNGLSNSTTEFDKPGINDTLLRREPSSADIRLTESEDRYHLELEIVGYIKEDFNFYITPNNDLVLTTAKSMKTTSSEKAESNIIKHSYCYASAFLKRTFRLPKNIVRNQIFVDYKNHILSIELLKLNPSV